MKMFEEEIEREREAIDNIDEEITKLLTSRFEVVERIKNLKLSANIQIFQPERERKIIENLRNEKHSEHLQEIFKKIMEEAKKHQKQNDNNN